MHPQRIRRKYRDPASCADELSELHFAKPLSRGRKMNSTKFVQEGEASDQHNDRNPEMDVGDDCTEQTAAWQRIGLHVRLASNWSPILGLRRGTVNCTQESPRAHVLTQGRWSRRLRGSFTLLLFPENSYTPILNLEFDSTIDSMFCGGVPCRVLWLRYGWKGDLRSTRSA